MRVFVLVLTTFFVPAFASMAGGGGYIVSKETQHSTDVEVTPNRDSVSVVFAQATPGLIVFVLGTLGLILMTFRVPTNEVFGYRTEGGGGSNMGFLLRRKVLADRKTNIPLPVWWLVRRTERFERVAENAYQAIKFAPRGRRTLDPRAAYGER